MFNKATGTGMPRANSPEEVGVSSAGIAAVLQEYAEKNVESHSLMIIRHGKVAYEAYRKPYGPDLLHTMYSVSKSVTATAAGFAVSEGLLSLDTKLIDVFPEYRPAKEDESLEKITLHTLLTMTAGKAVSLMADKTSKTWVKDFINTKQSYEPGKGWSYISENTFCVSAMISRVAGMSLTDYLTPRLFAPLGITKIQWERDFNGQETGGWGLFLKTEDLAKIALCYLNKGVFNGRQVIPAQWIEIATKNHTAEIGVENGAPKDGYGYFIWGCDCCEDTYRFDGMFSQFAFVFNTKDAVVVMTDNEINEDKARACLENHIDELFFEGEAPEAVEIPEWDGLPEIEAHERQPEREKEIDGKKITVTPNHLLVAAGFPLSVLTFPAVYMSAVKPGPINNIKFNFYDNECTMYWTEGEESNIIHIGLDGKARHSKITLGKLKYTANSSGAWIDEHTFEVWIRPLEAVCQRRLRFVFKGGNVTIYPSSMPELHYLSAELAPTLQSMIPGEAAYAMFKLALLNMHKLLDADHRAKLS